MFIKVARLKEEWFQNIDNPEYTIEELKRRRFPVDVFTFKQELSENIPKYNYYMEYDNSAAITITTYEDWFNKKVHPMVRRAIRKSEKKGVIVKSIEFNDELVQGITKIYNETQIRQGRKFWHYGKKFDTVKKENNTFVENSQFVGAYINEELVGFMKIVFSTNTAIPMQILSLISHRDKAIPNALISKAVQICSERKVHYFVYGKISRGINGLDTLSEFKQRNGFEKIEIPRYYVPMSVVGEYILKYKLHHGLKGLIPEEYLNKLKEYRNKYYDYRYKNYGEIMV